MNSVGPFSRRWVLGGVDAATAGLAPVGTLARPALAMSDRELNALARDFNKRLLHGRHVRLAPRRRGLLARPRYTEQLPVLGHGASDPGRSRNLRRAGRAGACIGRGAGPGPGRVARRPPPGRPTGLVVGSSLAHHATLPTRELPYR